MALNANRSGHDFRHVKIHESDVHLGDVHHHSSDTVAPHFFKVINYNERKNVNPLRVPNTCQWILQSPNFINFRDNDASNLLWVTADPGCGKSVLARSLVDQDLLQRPHQEKKAVIYFFFKDIGDQSAVSVGLCSLIHQLICMESVWEAKSSEIQRLYHRHGKSLLEDLEELWRLLESLIAVIGNDNIICLLDALDEIRPHDQKWLLSKVQEQRAPHDPKIFKLIMLSRPYQNIENEMRSFTNHWPLVRLAGEQESEVISQEIDLVIERLVDVLGFKLGMSDRLQHYLLRKLRDIEHRTYLWLSFISIELENLTSLTEQQITRKIDNLPESVQDAYGRVLDRSPDPAAALEILSLIAVAQCPLHVSELDYLLEIKLTTKTLGTLDLQGEEMRGRYIRQTCGLFVHIVHGNVLLIHQTAKDFLLSAESVPSSMRDWCGCINEQKAHLDMTLKLLMLFKVDELSERVLEQSISLYKNEKPLFSSITDVIEFVFKGGFQKGMMFQERLDEINRLGIAEYALRYFEAHARESSSLFHVTWSDLLPRLGCDITHFAWWAHTLGIKIHEANVSVGYEATIRPRETLSDLICDLLTMKGLSLGGLEIPKSLASNTLDYTNLTCTSLLMALTLDAGPFVIKVLRHMRSINGAKLMVQVVVLAMALTFKVDDVVKTLLEEPQVVSYLHPLRGNILCHTLVCPDLDILENMISSQIDMCGGMSGLVPTYEWRESDWGRIPPENWIASWAKGQAVMKKVFSGGYGRYLDNQDTRYHKVYVWKALQGSTLPPMVNYERKQAAQEAILAKWRFLLSKISSDKFSKEQWTDIAADASIQGPDYFSAAVLKSGYVEYELISRNGFCAPCRAAHSFSPECWIYEDAQSILQCSLTSEHSPKCRAKSTLAKILSRNRWMNADPPPQEYKAMVQLIKIIMGDTFPSHGLGQDYPDTKSFKLPEPQAELVQFFLSDLPWPGPLYLLSLRWHDSFTHMRVNLLQKTLLLYSLFISKISFPGFIQGHRPETASIIGTCIDGLTGVKDEDDDGERSFHAWLVKTSGEVEAFDMVLKDIGAKEFKIVNDTQFSMRLGSSRYYWGKETELVRVPFTKKWRGQKDEEDEAESQGEEDWVSTEDEQLSSGEDYLTAEE